VVKTYAYILFFVRVGPTLPNSSIVIGPLSLFPILGMISSIPTQNLSLFVFHTDHGSAVSLNPYVSMLLGTKENLYTTGFEMN
jgi:hypothetical protein